MPVVRRTLATLRSAEFGFTREEAREIVVNSQSGRAFRDFLFERMIPNLKRVGLLTEAIRPRFEALGVLKFEDLEHDGLIDWATLEAPMPVKSQLMAAE
jgi:hypothetical protein